MPRTDEQIAEYMRYYISKPKDDRQWALETLARVEKKTEPEIIEICEKQGLKLKPPRGKTAALPEEKRKEIRAALREGLTLAQVAERCHVGVSTAGRIRVEMQRDGEELPKNVGGHKATEKYKKRHSEETEPNGQQAEQRQPEADPGQIYDDEPEPIVEEDVKVFIPAEQSGTFDAAANNPEEAKKNIHVYCENLRERERKRLEECIDCQKERVVALKKEIAEQKQRSKYLTPPPAPAKPPISLLADAFNELGNAVRDTLFGKEEATVCACSQPGLWFALRDSLSEFILGAFGAGTVKIGETVSVRDEHVSIGIETVDGKRFRCILRAEDDDE